MIYKMFRLSKGRWFYGIELVVDILIVALTYLLGYRLQRPELFPAMRTDVYLSIIIISVISLIAFMIFKPYKCGQKMYMQSMFDLIMSLIFIAVVAILMDFVIKGIGVWRLTIFYAGVIQLFIFAVYKYIVTRIHGRIIKARDCIIVGNDLMESAKIASKLVHSQNHLFNLKYIFKHDAKDLYDVMNPLIQVFICSSCDIKTKTHLVKYCAVNNIDCTIIPSMGDLIINSGKPGNLNDMMLLRMVVKMDIESKLVKRIIDIVVSFVGIVVTMPIMLIIYLAILIQDGENPIYSQKRLSRGNRVFAIYKFRTMIVDAEKHTGPVLASQNDTRITRVGKFLRASRMDELPQLFNVLKGDMSIVGPRPERPDLANQISEILPEFKYRTLVKPGVTGYAQVLGRYDTDFKDKLLFDLYYVNNYSLLLDLRIMFNTIRVLFTPSVTNGVASEDEENYIDSIKRKGYDIRLKDDCFVCEKEKIGA